MNLTVNGSAREVAEGTVVRDLLPEDCRGTAVAVNGAVVLRADHATTPLTEGDVVEIVTAVQGG
ncbi:sulfur carrier protein ThiS [Nocardioides kongjuensis]|uniref:Sulfur carrier protein n=1 Tax=Nocardioides kongjuensis TaxID=349522 RepID=A0A852RJ52_9ACTN|nr:sulfur carrier protein ThiS [Nocardioides kongjuensis]NYD29356.1 sulfur carrier protein [Nocardioides kongjuensis]